MKIKPSGSKPTRKKIMLEVGDGSWEGQDWGGNATLNLEMAEGNVEMLVQKVGEGET